MGRESSRGAGAILMAKGTFRIAQGATAPSGVPDAALFFTLAVGLGRLGCRGLIGIVRSAHRRLYDPDDDGGLGRWSGACQRCFASAGSEYCRRDGIHVDLVSGFEERRGTVRSGR